MGIDHNLSVEVLCLDDPNSAWLPSWRPTVHAIENSNFTYGLNRNLDHWLNENLSRFDAVIVHGIWMYFSFAVWKATRKISVPYFVFVHGALDPWFKRRYPFKHVKKCLYWAGLEHKVLRDAAAVFFTTEEEKRLAHNAFHPYECSAIVTGYGIAPPALNWSFDKWQAIRNLSASHPILRNRNFLLFLPASTKKRALTYFSRPSPLLETYFLRRQCCLPGRVIKLSLSG